MVLVAICFAAELYAAILLVNLALLALLVEDMGTDYASWFVAYEISVITGFSALTLESRSYRRLYAFLVMLMATLTSSALFFALLNLSRETQALTWLGTFLATTVILVKTPCYPASIWLPEAHVEASWPGSIVLAAFALKFSVFAALLFASVKFLEVDLLGTFLLFSVAYGALAMGSVVDVKKLVANFSIVHMSATAYLLSAPLGSEWALNFSWHHHSLVTSWLFLLIGGLYATTSSRLFRLLVANRDAALLFALLLLISVTLSLDLP